MLILVVIITYLTAEIVYLNKIIYDLEYIDIAHTTKNLILQGKYSSKPSVESEIQKAFLVNVICETKKNK